MGTEVPTKVMLGQTLVLMQMGFLNNIRKVGRLVLSRTSCTYNEDHANYDCSFFEGAATTAVPQTHRHLLPHTMSLSGALILCNEKCPYVRCTLVW
jgi:hypothetical protein